MIRGVTARAEYGEVPVANYRSNPYIEALPPINTQQQVSDHIRNLPPYDPAHRGDPPEVRLHHIYQATRFRLPLTFHLDFEARVSRALRDGYIGRNPLDPRFVAQLSEPPDLLPSSRSTPPRRDQCQPRSFVVLGWSGSGKTTGVEEVLPMYPQRICHSMYHDRPLTKQQLVWLVVSLPHDASAKGLCLKYFEEADAVLGTQEYEKWTRSRSGDAKNLMIQMARHARLSGLGLLVIDELQNMSEASSGGRSELMNFLTALADNMGVPVVFVGNYKAAKYFSAELTPGRRASGHGELHFQSLRRDVFDYFLDEMWRYQYTRMFTPLTPAFRECIWDVSGGVTDFVVKAFFLAQMWAVVNKHEKLTTTAIRSVARDEFQLTQQVRRALATHDIETLAKFQDVDVRDWNDYLARALEDLKKSVPLVESIPNSGAPQEEQKPTAEPNPSRPSGDPVGGDGTGSEGPQAVAAGKARRTRRKRQTASPREYAAGTIPQITSAAVAAGRSPLGDLHDAGIATTEAEFRDLVGIGEEAL